MRIAIISESPSMASGFGQQCRILVEGFIGAGHTVTVLAPSLPIAPLELPNYEEWRFANIHDLDVVDHSLYLLQPDIVLFFGCTGFISNCLDIRSSPRNCPTFFWLPYEGSRIPKDYAIALKSLPSNRVIHLSEFARKLWWPVVNAPIVIPHAVDLDIWKHDPEVLSKESIHKLRKKWAKRLRFPLFHDSLVVLNFDRNIWHKRWDATFDYVSKLKEACPEREVQLIAHTKMVQPLESKHPQGFNLPYLEDVYGLENQVCYTHFDWNNSLSREDLRELVLLSDVRLSTSEGEGFGVPTAETAAIGKLQIVNSHTTMPEILGTDNPQLVAPAMREERDGSIWAVPDIKAMVSRTIELLDDLVLRESAIRIGRLHVEERFNKELVVGSMLRLFEAANKQNDTNYIKYSNRFGIRKQSLAKKMFSDLAIICTKLNKTGTVLEVGSDAGLFVQSMMELGGTVIGMSDPSEGVARIPDRVKPFVLLQSYLDEWPDADIVVVTDYHDIWLNSVGLEKSNELVNRIAEYEWAIVRFRPAYSWGKPVMDPNTCRDVLTSRGMIRVLDLEKKLRETHQLLDHEIWTRQSLTEKELEKFKGA